MQVYLQVHLQFTLVSDMAEIINVMIKNTMNSFPQATLSHNISRDSFATPYIRVIVKTANSALSRRYGRCIHNNQMRTSWKLFVAAYYFMDNSRKKITLVVFTFSSQ